MKADARPGRGRAVVAGQEGDGARRCAGAFHIGVQAMASDHRGDQRPLAQPAALGAQHHGGGAGRLAQGLLQGVGGAVVDAAGEEHGAPVALRRDGKRRSRLLAQRGAHMRAQARQVIDDARSGADRAQQDHQLGHLAPHARQSGAPLLRLFALRRTPGADDGPHPQDQPERIDQQQRR